MIAQKSVSLSQGLQDTTAIVRLRSDKPKRPPLEKIYPYVLMALVGYCLANIAILVLQKYMLPVPPPSANRKMVTPPAPPPQYTYQAIAERNIFNADRVIPDPIATQPAELEDGHR